MTLAEAEEILGSWVEEPPAFLSLARIEAMLATFLGAKRRGPRAAVRAADPVSLLQQLGPGSRIGLGGDVHAGLPGAAVLDFDALKARHRHG